MTALTRTRNHVSRMYSGPRLTTMVLLLGVVGLLMYNAGNPSNWKWLESNPPEPAAATAQPAPLAEKQTEEKTEPSIRYDAASKNYDPDSVRADDPSNANFHWDADPDEQKALANYLDAVEDGTIGILEEESFGYALLLKWVKTRAFQDLLKASRRDWTFHDLLQTPQKHRGQLLEVPLNIVRILPYDCKDPTTGEQRKVYEVVGWSPKSKSWLYFAIVPELPEGMPTGEKIKERATLVGYFFKVQGYFEDKAPPRSKPLKAPLLFGRLAWEPNTRPASPPPRMEWNQQWTWWGLGALVVVYLGTRWWLRHVPKRRPASEQQLAAEDAALIGNWLENPAASELGNQEFEADPTTQKLDQHDSDITISSKRS